MSSAARRDPLSWAHDMAANQPAFVQCSTRRDPSNTRSAPPGHAAIEIQTLVPANPRMWGLGEAEMRSGAYRKSSRYREIKEIVAAGMIDRMEQAYPGSKRKIRWS